MRRFFCIAVAFSVGVLAGCRKQEGTVLGKAPAGQPDNIIAVRAGDTPPEVTLAGVMVEKCPVAGCWFKLQDSTGMIKVDTRAAGFVVANIPLEAKLTVAGKVAYEGDEMLIEARGIRY